MRITTVTIEPAPTAATLGHTEPKVVRATFTDGSTRDLFTYYSDELHFTAAELVGLTEAEVRDLYHHRDVAWLQS